MATNSLYIFEKYTKFGKTDEQIKRIKSGLRFQSQDIHKLMKESGVIDSKYTIEIFENDLSNISVMF